MLTLFCKEIIHSFTAVSAIKFALANSCSKKYGVVGNTRLHCLLFRRDFPKIKKKKRLMESPKRTNEHEKVAFNGAASYRSIYKRVGKCSSNY